MRKRVVTKAMLLRNAKKHLRELQLYKNDIDHWNDTRGEVDGRMEYGIAIDDWIQHAQACVVNIENHVDGPIVPPQMPASVVADILARESRKAKA
ncbi:MAG: hypothetical protein IT367_18180 [Candidatus Hydrogenedentes bacterium]|nr:hypothetical protein [Candidatus Hydrogenedentota bacterium]